MNQYHFQSLKFHLYFFYNYMNWFKASSGFFTSVCIGFMVMHQLQFKLCLMSLFLLWSKDLVCHFPSSFPLFYLLFCSRFNNLLSWITIECDKGETQTPVKGNRVRVLKGASVNQFFCVQIRSSHFSLTKKASFQPRLLDCSSSI